MLSQFTSFKGNHLPGYNKISQNVKTASQHKVYEKLQTSFITANVGGNLFGAEIIIKS
jgi:hypothetical protein